MTTRCTVTIVVLSLVFSAAHAASASNLVRRPTKVVPKPAARPTAPVKGQVIQPLGRTLRLRPAAISHGATLAALKKAGKAGHNIKLSPTATDPLRAGVTLTPFAPKVTYGGPDKELGRLSLTEVDLGGEHDLPWVIKNKAVLLGNGGDGWAFFSTARVPGYEQGGTAYLLTVTCRIERSRSAVSGPASMPPSSTIATSRRHPMTASASSTPTCACIPAAKVPFRCLTPLSCIAAFFMPFP